MRTPLLVLRIFASLVTLAMVSAPVRASGINLSWEDCGSFGVASKSFACDTNTGTHALVGSYVTPGGVDSLNGNEIVLDLLFSCASVPGWWSFKNAGSCRQSAASLSVDFTGGPSSCFDYWQGGALSAWGYTVPYQSSDRARLVAVAYIPAAQAGPVGEGVEVYSFRIVVDHTKTVGPSACEGCGAGACVLLESIKLTQNPGAGHAIFLGNPAARNYATWQGGTLGYALGSPGYLICSGNCPTPTRSRTWGAIKSLYR